MSSTDVGGKVSRKALQGQLDGAIDEALAGIPADNAARVARALFRRGIKELHRGTPSGISLAQFAPLVIKTVLDALQGLVRDKELDGGSPVDSSESN